MRAFRAQRYHLGKPTYVFPLFILSPVLIFYLALYFTGTDLSEARAAGWLYPEDRQEDFYRPWAIVYGGANHIDWSALAMCTVVWIVMLPIVVLDDLLKVSGREPLRTRARACTYTRTHAHLRAPARPRPRTQAHECAEAHSHRRARTLSLGHAYTYARPRLPVAAPDAEATHFA
eukprot:3773862-Pleurochrysis_carterae.AAC.1